MKTFEEKNEIARKQFLENTWVHKQRKLLAKEVVKELNKNNKELDRYKLKLKEELIRCSPGIRDMEFDHLFKEMGLLCIENDLNEKYKI